MIDIVELLQDDYPPVGNDQISVAAPSPLLMRAAAEISRLRSELAAANSLVSAWGKDAQALADIALSEENDALIAQLAEAKSALSAMEQKLADTTDDYLRRHKDAVDRFERIASLEKSVTVLRGVLERARAIIYHQPNGPYGNVLAHIDAALAQTAAGQERVEGGEG